MFTGSVGLEFRKGTVGMALLCSTLSRPLLGAGGWNIWACSGWNCDSWGWRSHFQEGFLIHMAAAWAEGAEGKLPFGVLSCHVRNQRLLLMPPERLHVPVLLGSPTEPWPYFILTFPLWKRQDLAFTFEELQNNVSKLGSHIQLLAIVYDIFLIKVKMSRAHLTWPNTGLSKQWRQLW